MAEGARYEPDIEDWIGEMGMLMDTKDEAAISDRQGEEAMLADAFSGESRGERSMRGAVGQAVVQDRRREAAERAGPLRHHLLQAGGALCSSVKRVAASPCRL